MNDYRIDDIISSGVETKGLDLLNTRTLVGSLSEADEFTSAEMQQYLLYSQNIQKSPITGHEPFPGEMLKPFTENIVLSNDNISYVGLIG